MHHAPQRLYHIRDTGDGEADGAGDGAMPISGETLIHTSCSAS